MVYDSVGKDTFEGGLDCLRPFGLMASFGNASGPGAAVRAGAAGAQGLAVPDAADPVHAHRHARGHAGRWPTTCSPWSASGDVKIRIDQRYALADVAQAHRDLEARKTTGCTVFRCRAEDGPSRATRGL